MPSAKFDALIFSGGGFLLPVHIGCVRHFEELDIMTNFKRISGFSSGSIVALCVVLGMNSTELEKFYYDMCSKYEIGMNSLDNMVFSKGMDDGTCIYDVVHVILNKFGLQPTATFADLKASCPLDYVFDVYASNITTSSLENFSVHTHPNMQVDTAVRMSCSIPFVFTPIFYQNCMYVDGCVFEPWRKSRQETKTNCIASTNSNLTLVCNIHFMSYDFIHSKIETNEMDDIFCYTLNLSSSIMKNIYRSRESTNEITNGEVNIDVRLNSGLQDILQFNYENTQMHIDIGYNQAVKTLSAFQKEKRG